MTEAEAVQQFRPFVFKTARRYRNTGIPFDDLVQEGLIAVALAFREWDPNAGASVLTWIRRPVRNAMSKLVMRNRNAGMKTPAGPPPRGHHKPPTRIPHASLDAPFDSYGFFGSSFTGSGGSDAGCLHDTVGTFEEPPDFLALRQLPGALARLDAREREIVRLYFVDGLNKAEIGREIGCSRENVRLILNEALRKLRRLVKGDPADVAVA